VSAMKPLTNGRLAMLAALVRTHGLAAVLVASANLYAQGEKTKKTTKKKTKLPDNVVMLADYRPDGPRQPTSPAA